jgi:hypothetical protein
MRAYTGREAWYYNIGPEESSRRLRCSSLHSLGSVDCLYVMASSQKRNENCTLCTKKHMSPFAKQSQNMPSPFGSRKGNSYDAGISRN